MPAARGYELADVQERGAVAGYVDGRIFASCGAFGVALCLPPPPLERVLAQDSVGPLRYFPKGHVKKQYTVLASRAWSTRASRT